ncbi:hypothetical protein ACFFIS_02590 [Virgibacillus soli]|uniref:Phage protein n=1 Tax=Paracerasibacillus soli TaxID=480284 RepID=A0ABU5CUS1_9BACI|nr:hypothetical protein [Virgibacillus soli]MDY0410117.1 hypothetical protein [Virgibacillus soli]
MENKIIEELERISDHHKEYEQLVLIEAAKEIIKEQHKRIAQMEGQLDGTLWSPKNWGD